jgi:hypothetical protein
MKTTLFVIIALLQSMAWSEERQVLFDSPGHETSSWKWRPVTLTTDEEALLAKRSDPPKVALDYYLLLSGGYFTNIAHEIERRITFIDRATLSDKYLHAEYTIPSCDAGAFSITIRIFGYEDNPLIAVSHRTGTQRLFAAKENGPQGLWAISVNRPEFWQYRGGAFAEGGSLVRVPDSILPELSVERILDRYRNHYKAHLIQPTQQKSIWLTYELPQEGNIVQVTGRENFMDPGKRYVWAEYAYNGDRFIAEANSEQDGTGQPATRPESKAEGGDKSQPEAEGRSR